MSEYYVNDDVWIKKLGEVTASELAARYDVRKRPVPNSSGSDPNIYTVVFGPVNGKKGIFRFHRSKYDASSCLFGFTASEVDIRQRFFYPFIKKDDVVIDAGASWGTYSIPAGVIGANVHCFEIQPEIAGELQENVKLNNLEHRITVNTEGLSNDNYTTDWDECKAAKFVKLDDYLLHRDIDRLDFVKLDVEGMELMALEGAKQALFTYKPKLQIEVHLHYNKALLRKVTDFLINNISNKYQRQEMILTDTVITAFFQVTD
jgi:FkbM family methyltransferase